jgi:NAD(P)-dependent dehydrogenase (short-subunit alcohol dehydrogenase family)
MNDLQGKVALVTGAATESGLATARALAAAGAALVLCSQQGEEIQALAGELRAAGGRALAVTADLRREDGAAGLAQAALGEFGRIDLLVLISAVWGGGFIHEHSVQTWDLVMAANLRAPFLLARAVLPDMRARRSGHVIVLSADSALGTYPRDGAYGVSLHALNALSEAIRLENAPLGIRVDLLCTGLVLSQGSPDALQPQDVADWIVWLATRPPGLNTGGAILVQHPGPPGAA